MEEILRELIKSTLEKGAPRQFYSNLTITGPLHEYSEVNEVVTKAISYLERTCDEKRGFQSQKYSSRNCEELEETKENDTEDCIYEIYTSTIILDLLGDIQKESQINVSNSLLWKLKEFISPDFGISSFNLFKRDQSDADIDYVNEEQDEEQLPLPLPDDCNTTALAVWVLLREAILERKPAESLAQLLLCNGNEEFGEGTIQTYLLPRGNNQEGCIEPVVCANVMRLLYQLDLGYEGNAECTEDFLYKTLKTASFLLQPQQEEEKETFDYLHSSPDSFLYFLSRAVQISPRARKRFGTLLAENLYERIGSSEYPLDLSMRILAAEALGLLKYENQIRRRMTKDYDRLLSLQSDDGSWPPDSLFKVRDSLSTAYFGGKDLSTAFAAKAIDAFYCSRRTDKLNQKQYHHYDF